jgi:hypothetical protein
MRKASFMLKAQSLKPKTKFLFVSFDIGEFV